MEQDGHLKTLAERMKEKAEQERIETEKVFTEQLQTLSSNLQASSQDALRTMSDAMAQEITNAVETLNQHYRLLSMAFAKKWIGSTVLGIFLCFGMMLAGWGIVELVKKRLTESRNELAQVQAEQENLSKSVEVLNKTLETLWNETSGIAVMSWNGSRYVIGPPNSQGGHTIQGRPAIKLEE